jgi:hypothetical protein
MTLKPVTASAPTALDDDAVVPEELIGRLLHASESAILDLLDQFSPAERANLAMFCYRKTHLRQIGLSIAATCELSTLVQAWGTGLGRALFTQSRDRAAGPDGAPGHHRPKVTLARLAANAAAMPMIELDD